MSTESSLHDHPITGQTNPGEAQRIGWPFGYTSQDPETAHSLLMHHSAGIAMLVLGVLVLMNRLVLHPNPAISRVIGTTWLLFGLFVFINGDPEGWPIGPVSLVASFAMPTAGEWMQHKVLSFIPMFIGISSLVARNSPPTVFWAYVTVGLATLGGFGLMIHQHSDHTGVDIVNIQHRLYAVTVLFIAASLAIEMNPRLRRPYTPLFMPCGLMLLGFQLTWYVE